MSNILIKTMSNTSLHGGEKNLRGFSHPACLVMWLGQRRDPEGPDTLSANAQFAPLPAEAG